MPISNSDQLFKLIKSLDKAEKRNFKLYAKRIGANRHLKFIKLFEVLDGQKTLDQKVLKQRLAIKDATQFSNLKRHLYSQILKSLRLIHSPKQIDFQIREQIDYAKILFNKALYAQAFKILERIKSKAKSANQDLLTLEIVEFQKQIESHYSPTRSITSNKFEKLIKASDQMILKLNSTSQLLNFKLKVQERFEKNGQVKNAKEAASFKHFFESNLPLIKPESALEFFEKVYLQQSYVCYHLSLLNYEESYIHAKKWLNLLEDGTIDSYKDYELIFRAYHYLLNTLFYLKNSGKFYTYLNALFLFYRKNVIHLNESSKILYFVYSNIAKMDQIILDGNVADGDLLVQSIMRNLEQYKDKLDLHWTLEFYYKFAWIYIMNDAFEKAIDCLNLILNQKLDDVPPDILAYSRILELISHLELEHYDYVFNKVDSAERYFTKINAKGQAIQVVFKFLKTRVKTRSSGRYSEINSYKTSLSDYLDHPFERRIFNYFHFVHWLESKKSTKSIGQIIQTNNS